MNTDQNTRKAHIKVNQQIVKHLSLGLYRNFALAIKELISNAYDADATEVKLKLDIDKGRIVLRDNGRGMSEDEFKNHYLTIGFFKEPSRDLDELGRMRIGTFGIGFLAPLPYCKVLRIITKKRGDKFSLEGIIQADDFFTKGNWDIKDAEVEYRIQESDLPLEEGETIIILEEIKEQIYTELSRETKIRRTIEGSGYEKFKWTLAQYCPIEFPTERKDLGAFFDVKSRVPMRLWLDGVQLYRNVPENAQILEKESRKFGDIKIKYVIMTPYEPVQPEEMRGLQLRLKDVAIGFPRDFEVTKLGRNLGKLNLLCGEVHVLMGLDNALLVNRDSFNFTEEVAQIYEFFRERLTFWNDRLYEESDQDKELYLALGNLREDKNILADLSNANLLHFPKERLRLSEGTLRKSKSKSVENSVDRVINALSKKIDASEHIIRKKGITGPNSPAIQIEKNSGIITVYEDHPAFSESIEIDGKIFSVEYDEWNISESPYRICRLGKNQTVIFNKSHPLFKGKLNDNIVKHISLGILLILDGVKDNKTIIEKLNKLLEDAFTE